MNNLISKETISAKLNSIISEALRIDKDKISQNSRIINDLNAESLDILDIRFSIEQEFGLKIGEHEFTNTIGAGLTATEFMENFTVYNLTDFVEDKIKNIEPEL